MALTLSNLAKVKGSKIQYIHLNLIALSSSNSFEVYKGIFCLNCNLFYNNLSYVVVDKEITLCFSLLQLKEHGKIHLEEREVYQCTYQGCGRFYTKVKFISLFLLLFGVEFVSYGLHFFKQYKSDLIISFAKKQQRDPKHV